MPSILHGVRSGVWLLRRVCLFVLLHGNRKEDKAGVVKGNYLI